MCVICYKPAGEEIKKEYLENMLDHNPDGAGYVYFDKKKKKMILSKGYLNEDQAIKAIMAIPKKYPAIIHCRIKTHGKNSVGQTHPFPVVADTRLLEEEDLIITGNYVMAHNGVFHDMSIGDEYSDTEAFIYRILAPLAYSLKDDVRLIDNRFDDIINMLVKGNKIAIMDGKDGSVKLYGEGWKTEGNLAFSNSTYSYKSYYYSSSDKWTSVLKNIRVCALVGDIKILRWNNKANAWKDEICDLEHQNNYGNGTTKYFADCDGNVYALYYEKGNLVKLTTVCIEKPFVSEYYCERNAITKPYREWLEKEAV